MSMSKPQVVDQARVIAAVAAGDLNSLIELTGRQSDRLELVDTDLCSPDDLTTERKGFSLTIKLHCNFTIFTFNLTNEYFCIKPVSAFCTLRVSEAMLPL